MTSRVAVLAPEELEGLVERAVARALAASPPSPPSDWIKAAEAAKIVGVSTKSLSRLRREAGLPAHEPAPGLVRYKRSEIDAWMQARSG